MLNRRTFLASGAAAACAATALAYAQPNTIRLLIPYSAGTTPDLLARAVSPALSEKMGRPVLVENKPGASGILGMRAVAQSTDPNTLMIVPVTTAVTLPHFYKDVDIDLLRSFTPITQLASNSFVLVVNKALPINNFTDFVHWVKNNPGSFFASPDNGTDHHLFMEMLLQSQGLKMQHAAYKRTAPAVSDLVAGTIPAMFLPIQMAISLRDGGRLKIIGNSLRNRHPGFPDIPSLAEQGAKDFHAEPWLGAWGSPAMTGEVADRFRAALAYALAQPATSSSLSKQGLIPQTSTAIELNHRTKQESETWSRVIKAINIESS